MATITALDTSFGAVVTDVHIRRLDEAAFAEINDAFIEYALLIFPEQHLTRDEQNHFAARFGDLEFPAAPITNIRRDGSVRSDADDDVVKSLRGNEGWHHDSTYMPVQALGAVFTAEIVPSEGAATGWADMRAAHAELDDATVGLLEERVAHHSLYYSMGRAGLLPTADDAGRYALYGYHDAAVSIRPMVKQHPVTGAPNLLVGRHAHDVIGMQPDESEHWIDSLNARAVSNPHHVHHHQWTPGDAVLWDNRRLMHRGTPFDMTEPRRMWHTRIAGDPATEAALNHR